VGGLAAGAFVFSQPLSAYKRKGDANERPNSATIDLARHYGERRPRFQYPICQMRRRHDYAQSISLTTMSAMPARRAKNTAVPPPAIPDSQWRARFRRGLRAWYDRHARDLPWRRRGDAYAVWLSEVMLQQTQVATVRPYFERFLAAFGSIEALARAHQQQVLRLWEGLGYYRRARQLHQAAQIIVRDHGGQFPRDPEAVRRLPGIGRYTAGAILSIAFDAREPILEANTTRLFCRLLAYRGDPASHEGQGLLWQMAEAVLPSSGVGRFNQALMELGSQVCLPRQPACQACPVGSLCEARAAGLLAEVPLPKRKPAPESRREVALVVRRGRRVLVLQCPEGRRWAGLWDFPRYHVQAEGHTALGRELAERVADQTGLKIRLGSRLTALRHSVTRFRITLECYEARCVPGSNAGPGCGPARWVRPEDLEHYPLSTTGRRLARMIVDLSLG